MSNTGAVVVVGGCGRVGLPLALALAFRSHTGHNRPLSVIVSDINETAVSQVNCGEWPFSEASFAAADSFCAGNPAAALKESVAKGWLKAVVASAEDQKPEAQAVNGLARNVNAIIFAIPTDTDFGMTHAERFVKQFAATLEALAPTPDTLLIVRSTIPPGTIATLQKLVAERKMSNAVVYAPERTAQGKALLEILALPQLLGASTDASFEAACDIFGLVAPKLIRLTPLEAEYAKLLVNSWRYSEHALSNQFFEMTTRGLASRNDSGSASRIFEAIRLDYPRSAHFSKPGFSGGPCLLKDTAMLMVSAGTQFLPMSSNAIDINFNRMPRLAIDQLGSVKGRKVTLLGAAFKPDVDDTRSSLTLECAKICEAAGAAEIVIQDPMFAQSSTNGKVTQTNDLKAAVANADGIVLCASHAIYFSSDARSTIEEAVAKGTQIIDISASLAKPDLEIRIPFSSSSSKAVNGTKSTGQRKPVVLVTGSAGFIGGYLVDELLAKNYKVIGLDNHSKYGPDVTKARDSHPDYEFVRGDAKDTALLKSLAARCDYIIAGAAIIGGISLFHARAYDLIAENDRIMGSTYDAAIQVWQEQALEREKLGSEPIWEADTLSTNPLLRKVVVVSSSMVFENTAIYPTPEGAQKTSPPPSSTYGFQKLACEYYAQGAWEQYGVPYTIVRPFNCVGIGERRALHKAGATEVKSGDVSLAMSHVVPDLVQKVLKGQDPLRILGGGGQVRHYTYGGDLARGIRMAMEGGRKVHNEDFNLSTATSTTVLELAEMIWIKCKPAGTPFRWDSDEPFKYDVQKRVPDVTKAAKVLGFEATTPLSDMLDEIIPWIEEQIKLGTI